MLGLPVCLLLLSVWSVGQITAESYGALVQARLNDTKGRLRQLGEMANRQTVEFAKMNLQLSDKAAHSPAWADAQSAQAGIAGGLKELLAEERDGIAANENYLNGVANPAEDLAASLPRERAMAQTIATVTQLLGRQDTAVQGVPQPDRAQRQAFVAWSMAFHSWERDLDNLMHVLEDWGRVCRNRAGEYETLLNHAQP